MSVEARPVGIKCNLQCLYCYQHTGRDVGEIVCSYNMEKMKAALKGVGVNFTVFGGEGLLLPEKDLEELWAWGHEHFAKNGIQTNATLINENHIRLFKKYKVSVGISVDGPCELNDARWAGTIEKTREATAKVHSAIKRLIDEAIDISLIITLHRCNATQGRLLIMHNWLRYLDGLGVKQVRLHLLEIENDRTRDSLGLSVGENIEALYSFSELQKELSTLRFRIFEDMLQLLLGCDKDATCTWVACDPYTTVAVQGVESDGQFSNCDRINKDGIQFVKIDTKGYERYIALYHTPQEHGGCQGCRFFMMCKGWCPGTAADRDWRNRTQYCDVWKELFTRLEKQMLDRETIPLSVNPDRKEVEHYMVKGWSKGLNWYMADILTEMKKGARSPTEIEESLMGYISSGNCHGDMPHGDASHGDHTDHRSR